MQRWRWTGKQSEPLTLLLPAPSLVRCRAAVLQCSPTACPAPCRAASGTSSNPGKLLKKLRKQRLAATKGIIKGALAASGMFLSAGIAHGMHSICCCGLLLLLGALF